MLDILFNALNTWGPLGNLKQVPLGATSPQQWANSSYSIIFGSSTNWILGFGRSTNIIGPDTKWVMDWNDLWNLIPIKTSALNYVKALSLGAVGATDLIIGPKTALNYGTKDISVTSKREKSISITYSDVDDSKAVIRKVRIAVLLLGSLVTISLNVLARIANMSQALASSATTRTTLQVSLQLSSNALTPRMISLLTVLEVAFDCVEALKKQAKEAKEKAELAAKEGKDTAAASTNLILSDVNNNQSAPLIQPRVSRASILLAEQKDSLLRDSQALIQEIQEAVPSASQEQFNALQARVVEIERSTAELIEQRGSYALAASDGPITFNVSNDQATVTLSPTPLGGNASIRATNSAVLNATKSVQVESAKHVGLRVTDVGSSQSNLSLQGTGIILQCGDSTSGLSFTMNGDGKAITLAQGNKLVSPTCLEISDSNLELSSKNLAQVGKIVAQPARISLSALSGELGSKITADATSINLSIGLAKITADQSSIKLEVGQSSITIDLQGVVINGTNIKNQVDMLIEQNATFNKRVIDAIEEHKSSLEKAGN